MKRKRKLIGIVLLGLFLAYFSASFIFVPQAPGLKDRSTHIVKFEKNDENLTQGLFRSSTEQAEDAVKIAGDYAISFIEDFHTAKQQSRLEALQQSQFLTFDIYLSLRRLQI